MPSWESVRRAKARGEGLRAELLAALEAGPASAVELLPRLKRSDLTLSEVGFQLERLSEEGRASGEVGGSYRLSA